MCAFNVYFPSLLSESEVVSFNFLTSTALSDYVFTLYMRALVCVCACARSTRGAKYRLNTAVFNG